MFPLGWTFYVQTVCWNVIFYLDKYKEKNTFKSIEACSLDVC